MPMRKHEMIYVFYEKLPFYDLSSHKHKFLNSTNGVKEEYNLYRKDIKQVQNKKYDPPLPVSVVKEVIKGENNTYNTEGRKKPIVREKAGKYETPLPVSVVSVASLAVKEETGGATGEELCKYDVNKNTYGGGKEGRIKIPKDKKYHEVKYNPPLPNSMLEIKSTRGKHSTEKPVALMEWVLKYYSKEGDVVLDPTMGSGSTGIACKNMNRNFIGIEKDPEIYEVAVNRIED
tara:strand:- start:1139 stop:1834 length:696 start_codon:yes stop_codon:yes gene_type:complete